MPIPRRGEVMAGLALQPLPRSATISLLHASQPSASFTSTEELAFSPATHKTLHHHLKEKKPTTTSLPAAPAMRRLPLRLLRSAAAGSLRSPTLSRGGCPVPRAPHLPAEAAAAPAELARWLPRRGYSRFASGFTPLEPKKLGSILDVERANGLSPEHLVAAWDDYHLGRGHIGVSMKAKLYRLLEQRSATCPYFVIPLWRGSGYTTMFMQVQLPHMIFTGLEDYKARGTQASPYYTITHFTEFAETKDTVLV